MLNHGNPEVVIFLIWCFTCILFYCYVGNIPGFWVEGRTKEQIEAM